LRVDPLSRNYPYLSPYAFAENDVIRCIDLDGAEKLDVITDINVRNYPILRPDGTTDIIERAELLKVYVHTDNISDLTNGTQRTTVSGSVAGYELDGHRFRGTYIKGKFVGYEEDNDTKMIQPSVWKPEYYSIVESRSPHSAMKAFSDFVQYGAFGIATSIAFMPANTLKLGFGLYSLASSSADFGAQMCLNGGDISKWNITSTITSGIFKNPFAQSGLGSAFEIRPENISNRNLLGNTILGDKKLERFAAETIVGGTFNYFGGQATKDIQIGNPLVKFIPDSYLYFMSYTTSGGISNAILNTDNKK
jgi:hypothetical protein